MIAGTVTGVTVLDKAMSIVDACEVRPRTAAELAEELEISTPTAYRLVRALRTHGLLSKGADGLLHHGTRFRADLLERTARGPLRELADTTGESAQLWVRRGEERVCRESASSANPLRAEYPVGTHLPLDQGGTSGRALLGEQGPEGWVQTEEPTTTGLCGVSAPIRLDGEIVGAVCVVAPIAREGEGMGVQHGAALLRATAEIERAIARA